jgi:ABC-type branched-subunit amino acid transport system ATPase component
MCVEEAFVIAPRVNSQRLVDASATSLPPAVGEFVLRARGIVKSFGGQRVLNGLDLCLRQGEVVLLRGENGSGKTTLLNVLTGNLAPDRGVLEYSRNGAPLLRSFPSRPFGGLNLRNRFSPEFIASLGIGRSWQDVRLFKSQSLRDNIAVADLRAADISPLDPLVRPNSARRLDTEIYAAADSALQRLGLGERLHSSADMISLGQSKRVAIARAVAAGAKVLLLDEPLAGLDRKGIDDVVGMLSSLIAGSSLSLVIVEHAFSQVHLRELVTTDWYLENGNLISSNAAAGEFEFRRSTQAVEKWSWLKHAHADLIREPLPRGAKLTRVRSKVRRTGDGTAALDIDRLIVKRGPRVAVGLDDEGDATGFSLRVEAGEIALLEAPNGWGKSTLFDAICGNVDVAAGHLRIAGSNMTTAAPWLRRRAGLHGCASGALLFGELDVDETMQIAGVPGGNLEDLRRLRSKKLGNMSGGERQRVSVSIAIELARVQPGVLVLDEPLAMLDGNVAHEVVERLHSLRSAVLVLAPATS